MVQPVARIRPFRASDENEVRFSIAKATMEGLAAANVKSYTHFLTIAVWIALSCVLVEYMQWWPNPQHGIIGYLSPLPAFASTAVPILALIDWLNRPYFQELSEQTLCGPDLLDIAKYYSRSPSSGFWILEYADHFVGLVALDASHNSQVTGKDMVHGQAKLEQANGTSDTAVIRHIYVDEPYRKAGAQKDLLEYAIRLAFDANASVKRIKASSSPLREYAHKSLIELGFKPEGTSTSVGLFGWKSGVRTLERVTWEQRQHK